MKNNQQRVAVTLGYLLVALLFFGLGKLTSKNNPPAIRVEEPQVDLSQIYDNLKPPTPQAAVAGESTELNCEGKIKGNISSSGKIYHVPGGVFYKRTVPEICFDTESAAAAAGFRKSKR